MTLVVEFFISCISIEKTMKTIFSILLLLGLSQNFKSQTIIVNSATSQDWAGGVCCTSGTNYQINLKVTGAGKKFKLDTLWIGEKYFLLDETNGYSVIKTESNGEVYYTLNAGISENKYKGDYGFDLKKEIKKVEKKATAPKYSGSACIVYIDNNKKKNLIEIAAFKELPYLAYP